MKIASSSPRSIVRPLAIDARTVIAWRRRRPREMIGYRAWSTRGERNKNPKRPGTGLTGSRWANARGLSAAAGRRRAGAAWQERLGDDAARSLARLFRRYCRCRGSDAL